MSADSWVARGWSLLPELVAWCLFAGVLCATNNSEALTAQGVKRAEMVLRKVVAGEVVELPDGSK